MKANIKLRTLLLHFWDSFPSVLFIIYHVKTFLHHENPTKIFWNSITEGMYVILLKWLSKIFGRTPFHLNLPHYNKVSSILFSHHTSIDVRLWMGSACRYCGTPHTPSLGTIRDSSRIPAAFLYSFIWPVFIVHLQCTPLLGNRNRRAANKNLEFLV